MAQEAEIKLELPPAALERLEASGWLGKHAPERRREELRSVYFDTSSRALRAEGVVLRVRHNGSKRVQVVKFAQGQRVLTREESEHEIETDVPDGELIRETVRGQGLQDELEPVFETRVERTVVPLHRQSSEIELVIDRGEIRAGRRREPISEIEIELKSGKLSDLLHLARALGDRFELRYGARSQAERGYALADGNKAESARAEGVELERELGAADALQRIGLACLRHFEANRGALERGNSHGVHQSRVALRRLRAALSLFGDLLGDDEAEQVKQDLRWLASQLGPARDYDVFIHDALEPLENSGQYEVELRQLASALGERRDEHLAEAQRAAAGERARKVLLRAALWLLGGEWLQAELQHPRRIKALARRTLSERTKKLKKKLRRFEQLDPSQRHKVRIAVKKLHYGTEFFASLFPKRKRRRERYLQLLKALQDQLGQLNDIHAHEAIARELVHASRGRGGEREAAFGMGLVLGLEQARAQALDAAARKTGKKLARSPAFWT